MTQILRLSEHPSFNPKPRIVESPDEQRKRLLSNLAAYPARNARREWSDER